MHRPITPARWISLPTGNLFSLSALSFMTKHTAIFFNGLAHLFPEGSLLNQGVFAENLFHANSPPIVLTRHHAVVLINRIGQARGLCQIVRKKRCDKVNKVAKRGRASCFLLSIVV